ncbi:hypothetical protein ABIC09_006439 [Bradyrhizobium sp. S3.12.5]|uniref:hypothetical protein n=1 Tax=Bradyrhizobium sp. S3.12.5 TaxID=3156386 RepID=UPI003393AB3D
MADWIAIQIRAPPETNGARRQGVGHPAYATLACWDQRQTLSPIIDIADFNAQGSRESAYDKRREKEEMEPTKLKLEAGKKYKTKDGVAYVLAVCRAITRCR